MIIKKGSIRSMRFLTWIDMNKPEYLEEVSRQLWMRNWSRVRIFPIDFFETNKIRNLRFN